MTTPVIAEKAPRRRRARAVLGSALAASAALSAALVATAPAASASASGCTYGGYPVDRCVSVSGSGTYVNNVVGTVRYQTGLYLEIEMWGDGFYYRGHGNPNTPSDTTQMQLNLNRNLANGSWVCVAARWVDGSQTSPACVQIHN